MGGQVFKGKTEPIAISNVWPTVNKFKSELKKVFPGIQHKIDNIFTLGSTGKKPYSGDIDLGIDENCLDEIGALGLDETRVAHYFDKFSKRARSAKAHQIRMRAILAVMAEKLSDAGLYVDDKSTSNGVLFFSFPQVTKYGEQLGHYVQIDLNFGDADWLKFTYYSNETDPNTNIKGLHRTQLILHMFSYKGYTMSHNYGIKDKATQEIVATTPAEAIKILNDLYKLDLTEEKLNTYKKVKEAVDSLNNEVKTGIYNMYLKTLDSTRCDIPHDLQNYWWDNRKKLGLVGKFLPETSGLYPLVQMFK